MEVLTAVAIAPASFGVALLLQIGILKAIIWALRSKTPKGTAAAHIS